MQLASFTALLSQLGQSALVDAQGLEPKETDFLRCFTSLRRKYPDELAKAALETAILRNEARTKFPDPDRMYFTRPALEQASSYEIARYRSSRYRSFSYLVDLGCSIGSDSLALAEISSIYGLDLDPLRLAMAHENLRAMNLDQKALFLQADLSASLPIVETKDAGVFFDPARRTSQKRVYSVKEYQPPLSIIEKWLPHFPALGVKISPGVHLSEIHGYPAEVEFISINGDLKEAVLWFGPLRTARRRATLLPGPFTWEENSDFPGYTVSFSEQSTPLAEPAEYIYEPDPAILRAGLVEQLAIRLGAAKLDPDIAYLTSNSGSETPFARYWKVEAWFPFQLKRLRKELRARRVGKIRVKKRGSPLEPERLISQLRLSGDEERTVFLTHLRGRPIVILAENRD